MSVRIINRRAWYLTHVAHLRKQRNDYLNCFDMASVLIAKLTDENNDLKEALNKFAHVGPTVPKAKTPMVGAPHIKVAKNGVELIIFNIEHEQTAFKVEFNPILEKLSQQAVVNVEETLSMDVEGSYVCVGDDVHLWVDGEHKVAIVTEAKGVYGPEQVAVTHLEMMVITQLEKASPTQGG